MESTELFKNVRKGKKMKHFYNTLFTVARKALKTSRCEVNFEHVNEVQKYFKCKKTCHFWSQLLLIGVFDATQCVVDRQQSVWGVQR